MPAAFKKRKIDTERVRDAAKDSLGTVTPSTASYVVGQVYDVPLQRIRANPANARALYPTSTAHDLMTSLQVQGQTCAATGFVDSEGDMVLIDGHRRWYACDALALPTLRVEVRPQPANEQQLYLASRSANTERSAQTPLDDALVWRRLLQRKVFTSQVHLARALNLSESEVSRTLSLAGFTPKVLQALAGEPALQTLKTLNALREFGDSQGEERTLSLIVEAAREGYGYREIEARRKQLELGPMRRERGQQVAVVFKGGRGSLRLFEKGGRLELRLEGLSAEERAELAHRLEAVLQVDPLR